MANALGIASGIISAGSAIYGAIRQKKAAKEQSERQQKLQEHAQQMQLKTWEETNYPQQRAQMEAAGLNPGLLYGMGGTGGAQVGSTGTGQAQQENVYDIGNAISRAAQIAQIEAVKAQTEKTKAETKNIEGVDRTAKEQANKMQAIDLKVKEAIGAEKYAKQAELEVEAMNSRNLQEVREFEAWLDEAYDWSDVNLPLNVDKWGTTPESENNLIRRVKRAGLQEVIQNLSNLKASYEQTESATALNKIEAEIRDFKSDLTKLGLNETSSAIINNVLKLMFGRRR